MDVIEAILERRSIRKYTDRKITETQLEIILKAAMYAPSAVNKRPWHFIVFRNKEIIYKINEVHPNSMMLKQADIAILVCWDENLQHDKGYGPVDCAAATQNMLLAAHGIGLGGVWLGIYPRKKRIEAIHKIFCLPDYIQPFSLISLGYPGEQKQQPDRFDHSRIHYEKW